MNVCHQIGCLSKDCMDDSTSHDNLHRIAQNLGSSAWSLNMNLTRCWNDDYVFNWKSSIPSKLTLVQCFCSWTNRRSRSPQSIQLCHANDSSRTICFDIMPDFIVNPITVFPFICLPARPPFIPIRPLRMMCVTNRPRSIFWISMIWIDHICVRIAIARSWSTCLQISLIENHEYSNTSSTCGNFLPKIYFSMAVERHEEFILKYEVFS
jgi:hypothetical protein